MDKIIICILALIIIIYIYNDLIYPYIMPYVIQYILPYIPIFIKSKLNLQNIEQFTQNSSAISSKNNIDTTQFDTNWYLRDDKPIIYNNQISLPPIRYGFYSNGAYEDLIGQYFRHHIYPINIEQLITGLDTIYKFINNDIDIAFINEELLTRYIKKDCKYLTHIILDNLKSQDNQQTLQNVSKKTIALIYPPINFSAIGVGFHQDFYLIVNNFSNIIEFIDIKTQSIGILLDSYYYFIKICAAYGISLRDLLENTYMQITIENTIEELFAKFKINKYDGIFIVIHPKHKQLVQLSLDMKMRYIHIQKRDGLEARNNLNNLIPNQQGTISQTQLTQEDNNLNRSNIYSKELMDDLHTKNINETFNNIIKKYFQCIKPRSINLNKFYKSGNQYSYLKTYSTRMILVIRNDIPKSRVEYITRNYIDNLNKIRDHIDLQEYHKYLDNFSSLEFNYQELISFNSSIPLAEGSKEIYKKEGLIYYEDDTKCKI